MARGSRKWKYYKEYTETWELNMWNFDVSGTTTKEIKDVYLNEIDSTLAKVDAEIDKKKLEDVRVVSDYDVEYGSYGETDKYKVKITLKGKYPMNEKEKEKKDLKDKQARATAKLKKDQEKEEKELKERLEFERLKRKFGEE